MRGLIAPAVLALVLGCAGEDMVEPPTMTELESSLFTSCAFNTCHSGGSPAAGLNLEAPVHDKIVNVEASDAPGKILIVPGDPEASYIYEKLTSDKPAAGERMPPTAPLAEYRIDGLRAWIEMGAPND